MIEVSFFKVGRSKASFTKRMPSMAHVHLYAAVRQHLASREIDFTVDPEGKKGMVFAGLHEVGTFTWQEVAEEAQR